MDESIQNLPENIKKHLESVTKTSGLPDNEDSFEKIAKAWIEKKGMFESQIKSLDMIEVETFEAESKKPALLLTYSGSLLSFGSLSGGNRWVEYASIQLRNDVPGIVKTENTRLTNKVLVNQIAEFENGPIKATSALLKIAVCKDDVKLDEQEKRVKEATIFLTNAFVKINRTFIGLDKNAPEQFNQKTIVSYLADKNNLTKKQIKEIMDDYHMVLESGMLLGERVPVGSIGKLYLKKRPAKKARVGINPKTGEKITISAKPESYVPKIVFSKNIKQKSAAVDF